MQTFCTSFGRRNLLEFSEVPDTNNEIGHFKVVYLAAKPLI